VGEGWRRDPDGNSEGGERRFAPAEARLVGNRLIWIAVALIVLAAIAEMSYRAGFYSIFDVTASDNTIVQMNQE
jgi:hypothetical protein